MKGAPERNALPGAGRLGDPAACAVLDAERCERVTAGSSYPTSEQPYAVRVLLLSRSRSLSHDGRRSFRTAANRKGV
jgi:hypothetical protein